MSFRVSLFLYARRRQAILLLRRTLRRVSTFLATLTGVVIAVPFAAYLPNAFLDSPNSMVSGVHLTSAGIIGTALALVLTLSIVPAQRAADAFSSAILKLYARDRQLLFVFVLLSVLALISLLFGTNWAFGISARYTLAAQFVALGAALDALRVFYARALDLLNPATALNLVDRECSRYIRTMKRDIERLVLIHRAGSKRLNGGNDSISRWLFYSQSPAANYLNTWTDHLAEFAHKALARRDTHAADAIIKTMASIGKKYADSRRDSLVVFPDFSGPMPVPVSDVQNVLNPIHESLKVICEDAARQPSEAIVMSCLQAVGDMAGHAMTTVHTRDDGRKTAPLAHAPVFYLDLCAKTAIKADMDDALLTTIRAVGQVLDKISMDVDTLEAEVTALDCLFHIAKTSYARQAIVPCFKAVDEAGIDRPLSPEEYHHALALAQRYGLERLDGRTPPRSILARL
ncbi:MAG: hypothetical protein IH905_15680 [Proteobacteria bacterium]|nr:hypothetical protein [Pseudomonadota bacterium]